MTQTPRKQTLSQPPLGPSTWPVWPVVGLFWLATRLPFRWQHALGRGIGWLFLRLGRSRREVTRVNLRLCFPDKTEQEREALLRQHFQAAGIGLLETVSGWWAPARRFEGRYTLEGIEHLDRALERGHGALLLSAHFTTLEFCARILSLHRPFAAMYRPNEQPVVDYLFKRNREHHTLGAIERNDIKGLLRALKRNTPVWYAPDQSKSGRQTELIPFFGVPASTQTATHRIARVSRAPVLPFFGSRRPDGSYRLTIHPPLADFPTDDPIADTTRVNQVIEQAVLEAPEQYFWSHRRFKARKGLPDPYS
ncbi:LpxL/LpxP family Kdo(2)-lipid IV(A) lauroyl/palmitoleoyl acyltransferase [Thioalkalivibrio thiocyanoxidans]|uniref:Lipid A biosynthesis acyltransferase n=1 Tax=Thioalkalivibrio paradoxus ARh 1 TaxID=713585 RepID=W0DJ99_9GAMM|nr:lipid A biosynthesis acyltransferase [Thioalkalivibrio paradoxus ARh 1]